MQKGGNNETPGHARAPLSSMAQCKIALQDCRHEGSAHASIRLQKVGQLIHYKWIIYGGCGGSHPRCQTRGPAPAAKKHVRDLDFTKK